MAKRRVQIGDTVIFEEYGMVFTSTRGEDPMYGEDNMYSATLQEGKGFDCVTANVQMAALMAAMALGGKACSGSSTLAGV